MILSLVEQKKIRKQGWREASHVVAFVFFQCYKDHYGLVYSLACVFSIRGNACDHFYPCFVTWSRLVVKNAIFAHWSSAAPRCTRMKLCHVVFCINLRPLVIVSKWAGVCQHRS